MQHSRTFLVCFGLVLSSGFTAAEDIFDFKLTPDMKTADFDNPASALSKEINTVLKGQSLKRSDVLSITQSSKLIELGIEINNRSVFVPGDDPKNPQYGFRRTDLVPKIDPATAFAGTTVFHTSFRTNPKFALNLTHGYLLSSIELPTGQHVFDIFTGSDFSSKLLPVPTANSGTIRIRNFKTEELYHTELKDNTLYNFAVAVDWKANTLTTYASQGDKDLEKVAGPSKNDAQATENVEKGQWRIQLVKFPLPNPKDTAKDRDDIRHHGIQEGTKHGCFFSRMFVEDGSNGKITKSVTGRKAT